MTQQEQSTNTVDANIVANIILDKIALDSLKERTLGRYDSNSVPLISVEDYLLRLMEYLNPKEDSVYVLMLIYLNDYLENKPEQPLTAFNIHRLLAACLLLAYKFSVDNPYKNQYIANLTGLSLNELNNLEVDLLSTLNCNLFVSEDEYGACHRSIFGM
jgi:hypothetical protein